MRVNVSVGRVARPQGVVGKVFSTIFFSIFLAAGLGLSGVIVSGFFRSLGAWSWPESRCTIDASGVEEHPGSGDEPYVFRVRYHYTAAGGSYTSVRYRHGYGGSSDVSDAQRLELRYPPGAEVTCYVDPDEPTEAMLERPSLWTGLIVLFPLIFVAVGVGGIAMVWRGSRRARAAESAEGDEPVRRAISTGAKNPLASAGCLAGFFSIFLLAGLGFLIPFFGIPVWHVVEARAWTPVPCTILHSEVRTHSGEDSDTYSVEVLYSYRWPPQPEQSAQAGGREFKSSRYSFMGGSTSGYQGKADVVASLPEGSATTCWVDPADPTNAVLHRGFSGEMWFGLLPLVFVAVGAGGIVFSLVGLRKKRAAAGGAEWLPTPEVATGDELSGDSAAAAFGPGGSTPAFAVAEGPVELKPGTGPIGKFVGITLAALLWNGIVGVFVWKLVEEYRAGSPDGCLTLFLIPFVLVGLLLLVSVPYQFLAMFNPRPVLTLGTAAPRLGETTSLAWRFAGSAGRLRHLKIALEGQEEATYTRGTTTSTDKLVFATLDLVDVEPPAVASGSIAITVPGDTMHSFSADHNKIVWTLKVAGEIRGWPDVAQHFPLVVRPAAADGGER